MQVGLSLTDIFSFFFFLKTTWPAEEDEDDMICSETTPLPITPQEDQGNKLILQMHFFSVTIIQIISL